MANPFDQFSSFKRTKLQAPNFGRRSSRQGAQEAFNINVARKQAEVPFKQLEREQDIATRKLSSDEIRSLNDFDAITKTTRFIKGQIKENPSFLVDAARATAPGPFANIASIGDVESRQIMKSLTDASDRLLRLRSGAQINEQEFRRLRSLFPNFGDVITAMKSGRTDFIVENLEAFESEFDSTRKRILQGSQFDQNTEALRQQAEEAIQIEPQNEKRIKDQFYSITGTEL